MFIEFSVLNINSNLFSKFTLVFEIPPYGGLFTWERIETLMLYKYTGAAGLIYLTLEMICFLFYIVVIARTMRQFIKLGVRFLFSITSIVQITAIILIGCAFALYIYRSLQTTTTVEKMKNNKGIVV